MSELTGRQLALLELLKVTHNHAKDDRICLEVAHRYLEAIDALAAAPAPQKKAQPRS